MDKGTNTVAGEQEIVQEFPDRPPYANLFSAVASKSEVLLTLGCTVPGLRIGEKPIAVKHVYFDRFVTSRDGAEALAMLLVRLLWGSDVADSLKATSK